MTLTQTAILTKQIIIITLVTLVLSIVSFISYKIWHAYYLAHLPPIEEKPDTKFGVLLLPDFPKSNVSSSNFSYSLDTTTGGLPKIGIDPGFEKIIRVYFVTQTFATFLSPEKSQSLAQKFDIINSPEIISETKYKFTDQDKSLIINLDNGNFLYSNEATISATENPDDDKKLISEFKQFLANLDLLKDDLKNSRTKITLLRTSGRGFVPTNVKAEVQAVQISLWPDSIDNKLIFTPDFNKALINAIVIKEASKLDSYLSLDFVYYPIDTTTFATYPTKTPEVAFDDLKKGKGVVIVEPDNPQVSITAVSLGYYLSENYTPYLLPIFIFEGPNFVAYVPAINEQFQFEAK